MTKAETWVSENVIEDRDDMFQIAELSKKALYDKISMDSGTPEITLAMYGSIFNTIIKVLKNKRSDHDTYAINLANRVEIGYTTTDDDDAEKSGNFMIYMKHLDGVKNDAPLDEDEDMTIVLATQWNAVNITEQTEVIKEIATESIKPLQVDAGIHLNHSEIIIPTFCIIHDQIVAYSKIKRLELDDVEFELNVASLYNIRVFETDEGEEKIVYPQNVAGKLELKSDERATARHED